MNWRADAAQASSKIGKFLNWWGNELLACVPPGARRLVLPPTTKLLIEIHKLGTLKLTKVTAGVREPLMTVRPRSDQTTPEEERALKDITHDVDEVVISLPESCGVRRRVDLPAAARENLREVLTIEMDRLTPFKVDEIYFANGPEEPGRVKDQISVELTIVPKGLADDVMRMARTFGIEPDVLALGDDGKFENNLLGTQTGGMPPRPFPLNVANAYGLVAAVLVIAAVAVPFVKQAQAISTLESAIARAGAKGGEGEVIAQRLAAWREGAQRVSDLRARGPATVAVLNELSSTIPKGTWLTEIQLSGTPGHLVVAGYSSSATSLVAPLEASNILQGVKFDEPVSFDDHQSRDRFRLSADVVAANTAATPAQRAPVIPSVPSLRSHP